MATEGQYFDPIFFSDFQLAPDGREGGEVSSTNWASPQTLPATPAHCVAPETWTDGCMLYSGPSALTLSWDCVAPEAWWQVKVAIFFPRLKSTKQNWTHLKQV